MNRQSKFDAGYRMLGAVALGWPRGMVQVGKWEGGSHFVDQSLILVWLFANSWTAAPQASLSFTIAQTLLNHMSTESGMLSKELILCHTLLLLLSIFPSIRIFSSELGLQSGAQRIGTSVLPMNIQGWFSLGLTDLISLLFKGLTRVFSSTTVQKHQFFSVHSFLFSCSHIHIWLLEKS